MKIEGIEVTDQNYLDPVTYVPSHANNNIHHPDVDRGVIISVKEGSIMVLYCKSRTVQSTLPENLVWG